MEGVVAFAPAKVNLCLHVVGRRADGYHLLDSLVAFADIGDRLTARPAPSWSLTLSGREAAALAGVDDNLALRAGRLLAQHVGSVAAAELHLEKHLPVAAGIGGGSADAAATLRALRELWRLAIDDAELAAIGARLGADIPVCVRSETAWVSGIGERVEPGPPLPELGVVLVNPRRPLPTATVFAARQGGFAAPAPRLAEPPRDAVAFARWLAALRNDLTAATIGLAPEIGDVLAALGNLAGALLVRMSGSGATCFALFENRAAAMRARDALAAAEPRWWCAAGGLIAGGGVSR